VSECDPESSAMGRSWPTGAFAPKRKKERKKEKPVTDNDIITRIKSEIYMPDD
jgi:hypothetical protein